MNIDYIDYGNLYFGCEVLPEEEWLPRRKILPLPGKK
jgi:hypothetical protein